ncbi:lamin tail domain-containing protein [Aeribacillus pallidus]|uniref:lamin tail domain-containing protein n=1 Tax=Aeribacillus sp. FSL K6-1305 TaxID=2954569 RepID=UPI002871074E|nr:lamin tail domain-containing protein [Aeribacillus pallidus]
MKKRKRRSMLAGASAVLLVLVSVLTPIHTYATATVAGNAEQQMEEQTKSTDKPNQEQPLHQNDSEPNVEENNSQQNEVQQDKSDERQPDAANEEMKEPAKGGDHPSFPVNESEQKQQKPEQQDTDTVPETSKQEPEANSQSTPQLEQQAVTLPLEIVHQPPAVIQKGRPLKIDAEGKGLAELSLFYRTAPGMLVKSMKMEKINDTTFTATVPESDLWSYAFTYWFEGKNETETTRLPINSSETFSVAIQQDAEPDYQKVPKILITELAPDTSNVGSADGYEFIELYNNTNKPIELRNYELHYQYPGTAKADQVFQFSDNQVIAPQKTFILWVKNSSNQSLRLEDFNQFYGTNLKESEVQALPFEGMANSGIRALAVYSKDGSLVSAAAYNDGADDVERDKGIIYQFTEETKMKKIGLSEKANPGAFIEGQVPKTPVAIEEPDDKEAPVITHQPIAEWESEEPLIVKATVTDNKKVRYVTLFYKLTENGAYKSLQMTENGNQNEYRAAIPSAGMWGSELLYYIEASDGTNTVKTEEHHVQLKTPNIDYQKAPKLLITEVVPDSANINGLDGYEFIEIYNNTNQTIDFKDYKIRYRYPQEGAESDLIWGPPNDDQSLLIPSGGTLVFWIINQGNASLAVEDFNKHYGVSLEENKNIVKIYNNGMANSSARSLVIATNSGKEISVAHYNDQVNIDDTKEDKGILYKYPADGSNIMQKISAGVEAATPGSVKDGQTPKVKVTVPADSMAPTIENLTNTEKAMETDNIFIKAEVKDNIEVKTVSLYYRTKLQEPFKKVNLEENYNSRLYEHTIYSPELIGKNIVEYYFVAGDGTNIQESPHFTVQIESANKKQGLRLNVENGQIVSKETVVKATGDLTPEEVSLYIDGAKQTNTFRTIESDVYFAFDVRKTNLYFQNGVTIGNDILRIFDDTINQYTTITVPVSPERLKIGEDLSIAIRAGTKVSPFDETSEENRDDFYVKNVRLVLSDGTTLYSSEHQDPEQEISVGDSAGLSPVVEFTFDIPDEKFTSLGYLWNSVNEEDGEHEVKAVDQKGNEVTSTVIVDNSKPIIKPTIEEGKKYKGSFVIDAEIQDKWSKIRSITAKLDDQYIDLPFAASSAQLQSGKHQLVITAIDEAGNEGKSEVTFYTVDEHPLFPDFFETDEDALSAKLSVRVADPTMDDLDVSFFQAFQYKASDEEHVDILQNASDTEPPAGFQVEGEKVLSKDERRKLENADGEALATTSTEQFPYHRFNVTVDQKVDENDEIELIWNGSSLPGRKVTMYAWNNIENKWKEVASQTAGEERFQLKGSVIAKDYVKNQKVSVIVQDQIAQTIDYDYTFVWMSDTQYYSESYPHIYQKQVEWIRDQKDNLNIQYVFHTGDLVDEADDHNQWAVADQAMKVLDDAGIRYGVLAGNHDVGHKDGNYNNYYQYFGENRFAGRDYYGGSYKNNRGHYDLISANGNDYIMVYMGWGVSDEDLDWVNSVLEKYPDRKAILAFHEYLLVSGNRSPIGNQIFEKVVKPNKNVMAVLCGHYHDSETLVDEIDDNGDGAPDRKVYQILADYQGGPEGGQGYIRLLHFNTDTNQIYVKTYSPYLDDYNFYDPEQYPGKDEFIIETDLQPQEKKVATDSFVVNVYTDSLIGKVENVPSGEVASVMWHDLEPNQVYYWYTEAEDQFGGKTRSSIWSFQTKEGEIVPNPADPGEGGNDPEKDNRDKGGQGDKTPSEGGSKDNKTPSESGGQEKDQDHSGNEVHPENENHNGNNGSGSGGTNNPSGTDGTTDGTKFEQVSENQASASLPDTATYVYRWLLIGMLLIAMGMMLKIRHRKAIYK